MSTLHTALGAFAGAAPAFVITILRERLVNRLGGPSPDRTRLGGP